MDRVQTTKTILWMLTGLAAAVGITRFIFGLGATTNLTDATPWGVWIGFDVMAGVALAGGGFVMTAIFYVFKREKYHDLVKPAVLTAFLGYLAVVLGLMFDLGLPWNIWHMIIYWNPHSPLFEVGWCVMLYTTVLLLEFSPVPLEETSRYAKVRTILLKFRFPLVLLGIMLSTLHQSSLGSLFLIMPEKLHDLWYSSIMPVQFFISAAALGLMMVSLESLVSHWLYRRKPESNLVAGLAKFAVWVLAIYFIVKMTDIIVAGEFGLIFNGTWEGNLFILEMLISVIVPIILFSIPSVRNSTGGQWVGSTLVVFGMIFNRLNVGGITMLSATGDSYVPSWMEISISLGVVSAVALVFLLAVEKLHVWEHRPSYPESGRHTEPSFDHASEVWLGSPFAAARTKYSLAFVLAFAVGLAILPENKVEGSGATVVAVEKARGGDTLYIDGNHDTFGTTFNHAAHVDSLGQKASCTICHHMNIPLDEQSGCWECHRNMYTSTDVFAHDWHAGPEGGKLACGQCHDEGQERSQATAKKCDQCHTDLIPAAATIKIDSYMAPAYVDALHDLCVTCHRDRAAADTTRAAMALCTACHVEAPSDYLTAEIKKTMAPAHPHPVMLPEQSVAEPQQPGEPSER